MPAAVPPGQVVTRGFPVLHAGSVPLTLTAASWSLTVHGEVAAPGSLSFAELLSLPQADVTVDIHCVTSWTKLGTRWRGVPFRAIVDKFRPTGEAKFVVMECEQGFTTSLPLAALLDDDVLLAHTYDGAPLPAEHGGPVRMLVPKRYFYKSAKWLRGLKFARDDEPGFWEVRGYSNVADPWLETRYDVDDVKVIHRMRKSRLFRPLDEKT
ncbi:MAG TPA: sulfite oxidase-like oxidoreductase [Thermoplasmata archaeon]|nr:sulfite oxidase-like oxidoreductase [Thermoplasmata archaeon]HUI38498.1 sulfite oxidase-like oxidoreductase [Thermoplasmata archaeon]